MEIKEIIPNLNKPVWCKGIEYQLTAGIIRKDKQGKTFYQVEILDKCKNSVCIAGLNDIKTESTQ